MLKSLPFAFVASAVVLSGCQRDEAPVPDAPSAHIAETIAVPAVPSAPETGHGAGEVHVHGLAEMAVTLDGTILSLDLSSPLANFGLSEAGEVADFQGIRFADGLADINPEASCVPTGSDVAGRNEDGHGSVDVKLTWNCAKPGKLETLTLNVFKTYPGFETVNTVYIGETRQSGAKLTAATPTLGLK